MVLGVVKPSRSTDAGRIGWAGQPHGNPVA
jgi:hypothetical protein